ncbi:MAG: nicotinate-nucleotide adenylyltransferase [Bacteroidota bacterium]|nr:nicotinate-nucleotide adenylyltransferase [Bacteroidota bacterium]MDP4232650.1 nicotinate-nucleotide adenylyltransferase [Bacteroidota bacterium]MDP4243902.1 nicotinate-nucleotide adenylyltransferase [Bacteroidota bacterium]MDP4288429.1 nicotinate-nucleotide adenylyltransferase [Bacteroidota bacterium]
MNRLGVFGGTFDPPHLAHLIAGEIAVETCQLDKLLFIPAFIPPHKTGQAITEARHRLAMIRMATEDNPSFEVSAMEIEREGPSYTIDTLQALRQHYQPKALYLLIGRDQLEIFGSWYRADEILRLCKVVVFDRPASTRQPIEAELEILVENLTIPQLQISSTEIRRRVRDGQSIRYQVPESVRAYIREHDLYL